MFDIGWSELVVIGIVALIVIGPKELPGVLRALGHWMTKIRRMASEFQGQFQDAMREAEMSDLKKDVDDLSKQAENFGHFDPMESVQKEIDSALGTAPDANAASPAGTEPQPAAEVPPATAEPAFTPEPASTPGTDTPPKVSEPAAPQGDLATVGAEPKSGTGPDPGRAPA